MHEPLHLCCFKCDNKVWGVINVCYLYPTDDSIIMKTPAVPVFEGDNVILHCQYKTTNYNATTFFKNGKIVSVTSPSSNHKMINMIIENVTRKDEGSYKCASQELKMESAESWLSVRANNETQGQLYNLSILICVYILIFFINILFKCLLGHLASTEDTAVSSNVFTTLSTPWVWSRFKQKKLFLAQQKSQDKQSSW